MERDILIEELKQKLDLEVYVNHAKEDITIIPMLLDIIETEKTAIKYLCEKIIRAISEENPMLLSPFFERMVSLLDHENNFIKWGFILILPNMIKIVSENKWDEISEDYLSFLDTDSIAAFGNTVSTIWKILDTYPKYEKEIVPKLLTVDEHIFLHKGEVSPECINVAKGQIIDCFDIIYPESQYKSEIVTFVNANLDNPRTSVRRKAKRILKKYIGT